MSATVLTKHEVLLLVTDSTDVREISERAYLAYLPLHLLRS
jgi:hypothetical protein